MFIFGELKTFHIGWRATFNNCDIDYQQASRVCFVAVVILDFYLIIW